MSMRTSLLLSGLLLGGLAWAAPPENPPPAGSAMERAGERMMNAVNLPPGFTQKDLGEENDIRAALAAVTKDALDKGNFDSLMKHFVDEDRDRIGKEKDRDTAVLDGRIDQIRKAWKDKYGNDFDMKDPKVVFNDQFARIIQGEVTDPQLAVASWPLMPTNIIPGRTEAEPAAAKVREAEEAKKMMGGEKNLDKGRNVAIVAMSPMFHLPDLTVCMIHELPDSWRIDLPNDRTGSQIYQDLLTRLTWIGEHTDQWPADQDDARRLVTHHVLCGIYGVPLPTEQMGVGR